MVSSLKKRGINYYCTNCQMRQLVLRPNCYFCGCVFENYENIIIEEHLEDMKYESDIS